MPSTLSTMRNVLKTNLNKLTVLFFVFNLLISSFYLDNWFNPNSLSRALTTYSVVHSGNLQIDEFEHLTGDKCQVLDHFYSEKEISLFRKRWGQKQG